MEARRQGKSTPKNSETANRPTRQQENAQANTPPAPHASESHGRPGDTQGEEG